VWWHEQQWFGVKQAQTASLTWRRNHRVWAHCRALIPHISLPLQAPSTRFAACSSGAVMIDNILSDWWVLHYGFLWVRHSNSSWTGNKRHSLQGVLLARKPADWHPCTASIGQHRLCASLQQCLHILSAGTGIAAVHLGERPAASVPTRAQKEGTLALRNTTDACNWQSYNTEWASHLSDYHSISLSVRVITQELSSN